MAKAKIGIKSAGPAANNQQQEQIRVSGSAVTVRWPNFMLRTPRPAARE